MISVEDIKNLDEATLIELYEQLLNHLHYLESSIVDFSAEEEDEEGGEDDE